MMVALAGDNLDEADDGKMVCTLAWEGEAAPRQRIHILRSLLASRRLHTRTIGGQHWKLNLNQRLLKVVLNKSKAYYQFYIFFLSWDLSS